MKFKINQDYWACVYVTEKFITIKTKSGLGRVGADPLFPQHLLAPDATCQIIGQAVLDALQNSRTLHSLDERVAFFDIEASKQRYENWYRDLMELYDYKTKKSLFKNMKSCSIHCINGVIKISPSWHEKLEAWSGDGIKESDHVVLSIHSPVEEIGKGLRLALSRCR